MFLTFKKHLKPKIMASSPFTSWQIGEETMETVTDFTLQPSDYCTSALNLHSPEGPGFGLIFGKIGLSSGPSSYCKQRLLSETGHLRSPYLQARGPRPTYKLPGSRDCQMKLPHMNSFKEAVCPVLQSFS